MAWQTSGSVGLRSPSTIDACRCVVPCHQSIVTRSPGSFAATSRWRSVSVLTGLPSNPEITSPSACTMRPSTGIVREPGLMPARAAALCGSTNVTWAPEVGRNPSAVLMSGSA